MVPCCKYSTKINKTCYKCKKDNSLHWGLYPCYCLFYKPKKFQNFLFKAKLLKNNIWDIINSIVELED